MIKSFLYDLKTKLLNNKYFVIGIIITLILFFVMYRWDWTGFYYYVNPTYEKPEGDAKVYRTFWDWLELAVIPATVFILGYWLNRREQEKTRQVEKTRRGEDLLQDYLEQTTKLILDNNLIAAPTQDKKNIVTTKTKIILDSLNGEQKGRLLGFLNGVGLIDRDDPIVNLEDANFAGSYLFGLNLSKTNLSKINLKKSNLRFANLTNADLSGADIRSSQLDFAVLSGANLQEAVIDAETSWISSDITEDQRNSTEFTHTPPD
jgi:hypothetical protein